MKKLSGVDVAVIAVLAVAFLALLVLLGLLIIKAVDNRRPITAAIPFFGVALSTLIAMHGKEGR